MISNDSADRRGTAPTPRTDPLGAPWPGLIPLRPLTVPEILGAAARLVRGNAGALCGPALVLGLLGAAGVLLVLTDPADQVTYLTGTLPGTAADSDVLVFPSAAWLPMAITLASGILATAVISALTAVYATEETIGRRTTRAALKARMAGRWPAVLLLTVLITVLTLLGLAMLIFPGLIAMGLLGLAPAVLVIERRGPFRAMRRSLRLSSPVLWRIVGVTLLAFVISWGISGVGQAIVLGITDIPDWTTLVTSEVMAAITGAITIPFAAAALSVVYIDTRIRSEQLAFTLAAAARA